ncbi:MAG: CinA family protein [Anaerolineae bacterium]
MDCNELVRQIGDLLRLRRWMLATAESCTGGLLGHYLTALSGSSEYYLGGVIAYANEMKQTLLGVPVELLNTVGAVSSEVALEMARGACLASNAQVSLSTTGIAGPTGGTPLKPVGTVYIAFKSPQCEQVRHLVWYGDRSDNKERSVQAALELALELLK